MWKYHAISGVTITLLIYFVEMWKYHALGRVSARPPQEDLQHCGGEETILKSCQKTTGKIREGVKKTQLFREHVLGGTGRGGSTNSLIKAVNSDV